MFKKIWNWVFTAAGDNTFVCPLRQSALGQDVWQKYDDIRYCSWCGSVHPKDFVDLMKDGATIEAQSETRQKYILRHPKLINSTGRFYRQHNEAE